ncbi:Flp pilus assembly protein%2C protease CpaA [uncultured Roseburia sp.]|uniref:Prepilin peptidase n=1 Tax=Brotonthovivens ammoniilytica TaxID=2981725 RepID=A0ABT2TJ76_9FIRM|nr:prepilin peptidase [Brotonthovivens ammoniilytica]MCU6761891.1 prepilin peptidase [Brotonthovivens ammoniilytica]SCI49816.1 Flp pilus assembly protein%2C protease CpaA [uncultured Roseburia sp.]
MNGSGKDLLLQLIISGAVIMDCRKGRIKNWLIAAGLLAGIMIQILEREIQPARLLAGVLFPVLCCSGLFIIRALGAGDIKLFMVIGVFQEFKYLVTCIVFSFAAGAVISFSRLLINKNLFESLWGFYRYIQQTITTGKIKYYPGRDNKKQQIHFSIAVLSGFLMTMGVKYVGAVTDFI